jgi:hypothetical protein
MSRELSRLEADAIATPTTAITNQAGNIVYLAEPD